MLHGAEWPEKAFVAPRRRARIAEQCGRDVEEEVDLPVSQTKEGIANLPFMEELRVAIPVLPRPPPPLTPQHGGHRGSCAEAGKVGPTGTSAAAACGQCICFWKKRWR